MSEFHFLHAISSPRPHLAGFGILIDLSLSKTGQYHFTYILAPEKHKNIAAFSVGTLSVIGWWVITCSGISNNVQSIIGMIVFVDPTFTPQRWHMYLMYLALIAITRTLPVNSICFV